MMGLSFAQRFAASHPCGTHRRVGAVDLDGVLLNAGQASVKWAGRNCCSLGVDNLALFSMPMMTGAARPRR